VKSRLVALLVALFAISMFFVGRTYSDDKKMSEEEAKMMAEYTKWATPDERHKALDPMVGNWELKTKSRMDPTAQFEESNGVSEVKWILGNRYLQENASGDMGGMQFQGMGITGYDKIRNRYFNIWTDNMSTGHMASEGQMDSSGKTLTLVGSYPDVMKDMKETRARMVTKFLSNDQHTFEMYMQDDSGQEYKCTEITYTRKKQM